MSVLRDLPLVGFLPFRCGFGSCVTFPAISLYVGHEARRSGKAWRHTNLEGISDQSDADFGISRTLRLA
jgi:hypothetical protein